MTTDQTLVIQNLDPVTLKFDLQSVRNNGIHQAVAAGSSVHATFKKPDPVPSPFEAQTWAQGHLLVRENPYFSSSGEDGSFSIADLPSGEWEFVAWHERMGYLKNWPRGRFTRKIVPGSTDLGTVTLSPEMFKQR
jgi:hypothetical protein